MNGLLGKGLCGKGLRANGLGNGLVGGDPPRPPSRGVAIVVDRNLRPRRESRFADLDFQLRLAEFELKSSSLMLLATLKTHNRHVALRCPLSALKIQNYRTCTPA